jgi:predicted acylesterase/phospholipase RssA
MNDTAPAPFCDIVMEGGVTSGIVYPKAVVELSHAFQFHSIGGTSAGAIAAAATAAAEYRRRTKRSRDGFETLSKLPDELAPPGKDPKRSKLFSLFVPAPSTRALFAVLTTLLNRGNGGTRALALLWGVLRAFWLPTVLAAAAVLVIAWLTATPLNVAGWIMAGLLAAVVAVIAAAVALFLALTGPFIRNGYGICRGYAPGDEKRFRFGEIGEPLTLWLSRLINITAGLDPDGDPLTFGMLLDAPGFPPSWTGGTRSSSIDLQLMTTSLTHGRPVRFPQVDRDFPLYFSLDEMKRYFPENVWSWLQKHPGDAYTFSKATAGLDGLIPLPTRELPVIVAARLSLSFPFLLSAVPLHAIDFEADPWRAGRAWFSDGGLTSNFPIHLFDAALPLWPTFGISLEAERRGYRDEPVYMPVSNAGGRADPWDDFDATGRGTQSRAQRLWRFLYALANSARNWQDRLLARTPGIRDRVVRVRLEDDEGGLNLAMEKEQITAVAKKGADAGRYLVERFAKPGITPPNAMHPMDLDNHRWMRLRTLLGAIETDATGLDRALRITPPDARSWDELIQEAVDLTSCRDDQCAVTAAEASQIHAELAALAALAGVAAAPPGTRSSAAKRQPILRLRPNA